MYFVAGLMVAGSVIMVNLIVAIIITDVKNLVDASREQALVNEVHKSKLCHSSSE
jgi:hypothetical protein